MSSDDLVTTIEGPVNRIAIITTGREPCACYLARRLRESSAEIALFMQTAPTIAPGSWRDFLRLWKKRGPLAAIDNWLLRFVKQSVFTVRRIMRTAPSKKTADFPIQRPDPLLFQADWILIEEVERINSIEGRRRLREFDPDLVLLAGAPILSPKTIRIARLACINSHCGITPRYAGSSPIDRAIYEGRFDELGYTVHLAAAKVDGGAIIHQQKASWDPQRPNSYLSAQLCQQMYDRLADLALKLTAGDELRAVAQRNVRVAPPAGLFVKLGAEWRRRRYAASRRRGY